MRLNTTLTNIIKLNGKHKMDFGTCFKFFLFKFAYYFLEISI